jgi:hypothetical protein
MLLLFMSNGEIEMTTFKLLSAALVTAATLAAPGMARESHVTSRHVATQVNAI